MKRRQRPPPPNRPPRCIRPPAEWYESLLVAGIFVLFVRTFVVQTYQVPTGSMERTILVGDHLLVNKFAYGPRLPSLAKWLPYRDVHPGDIVVFKKPGDDVNPGNVLVKRAVAQGGDTVQVRDKQLYVNGQPEQRSTIQHIDPETYPDSPSIQDMARRRDQFGPFTVPPQFLLRHGRQPGQLARQPLLGSRSRATTSSAARSFSTGPTRRSRTPTSGAAPIAKIEQLAGVAVHFFSRTRWDRMFTVVK